MEQAMTQVYVDHNGYLWTFELVALPHSYVWVYECEEGSSYFLAPVYANWFIKTLGMELLGEL